jgi:hypothetical protein
LAAQEALTFVEFGLQFYERDRVTPQLDYSKRFVQFELFVVRGKESLVSLCSGANMFQKSIIGTVAVALLAVTTIPFPSFANPGFIPIPGATVNIPDTVTRVNITNATSQSVTLWATLQSGGLQPGCTTQVSDLQLLNRTFPQAAQSFSGSGQQGSFPIPAGVTYEVVSTLANPSPGTAPPYQNCLQGLEFTFNLAPNCGLAAPPNGVNGAEPTLNLPNPGSQEALDITCVTGANSIMQLTIQSPAGDPQSWMYDINKSVTPNFQTQNSWVNIAGGCDDNCVPEHIGVYPFGCTLCNLPVDPGAECGQFCASANGLPPQKGCNFGRAQNAGQVTTQFGGFITITYLGPAIPAPCSGTTAGRAAKENQKRAFLYQKYLSWEWKQRLFLEKQKFLREKTKLIRVGHRGATVITAPE